jgi:enamine deaminase RidA (YjgF/YER057c/UK114 family)
LAPSKFIELLSWGGEHQSMIKREVVMAPAGGPSHGKGMVQGIKAGGFIFFSAIRGNHPVTNYESSDTKDQARQAFENLKVLLGAAGAGLEHVVKVTLYLQDLRIAYPFTMFGWNTIPRTRRRVSQFKLPMPTPSLVAMRILLWM